MISLGCSFTRADGVPGFQFRISVPDADNECLISELFSGSRDMLEAVVARIGDEAVKVGAQQPQIGCNAF